jgi:tetratricopeptide (TPR) repeat protein
MPKRAWLALLWSVAATPVAAQWRQGLTDRGLDSLRLTTLRDSVDAEAQFRYGMGLWEKRRYDAADTAFRRAVALQPTHAGAHLALGVLPYGRGDRYLFDLPRRISTDSLARFFNDASRHSRDAFLYDPTVDLTPLHFVPDERLVPDNSGMVCFGGLCFRTVSDRKWWRPTRTAARLLVTGKVDSAYAVLGAALAKRGPDEVVPDDFIWYYALIADRTGRPAEAADGFRELAQRATRREPERQGISVSPRSRPMYLLLYGMASDRAGEVAVARAALREALLADLTLFQAHSRLADIAEARGETEEAISERRSAIAIAPELARLEVDLGISLLQMGRTAEARDAFTTAADRAPWDPVTQLFLFQSAVTLEDRPLAERALQALELYAPLRNREQVTEARRRLGELP